MGNVLSTETNPAIVAEGIAERLLVLRCQAGDDHAFTELVRRYQPRLWYYLRKMIGNDHAADDALQDVWLDVVRGLPRVAEPAAFSGWVYQVARRRAVRYNRGRRRAPEPLDASEVADDSPDETFEPDEGMRIHAAIGRLAPAQREVLILQFIEGMSGDEIARITGCPPGTVRSRIHYAKRELRAQLNRENET